MKKIAYTFLLLLWTVAFAIGQDLTPLNEVCPAQTVQFTAPAYPNTTQYNWDFCTGDMLQTPQISSLTANIDADNVVGFGMHNPESMDIVFDGINWYGFIANRGDASNRGTNLIRADFGNSLDNLPTYTSLGNPGGVLYNPRGIKVIKNNGNWFAFITNCGTTSGLQDAPFELAKIDFGTSLANNTPSGVSFALGDTANFAVIKVYNGGQFLPGHFAIVFHGG